MLARGYLIATGRRHKAPNVGRVCRLELIAECVGNVGGALSLDLCGLVISQVIGSLGNTDPCLQFRGAIADGNSDRKGPFETHLCGGVLLDRGEALAFG